MFGALCLSASWRSVLCSSHKNPALVGVARIDAVSDPDDATEILAG